MTKTAKTTDEAWSIQETYEGKAHGWIQWKGTNVCMDFYCACGAHLHIDDEFCYHVKCMHCGSVYMMNGHVEAIKVEVPSGGAIIEAWDDDFEEKTEVATEAST